MEQFKSLATFIRETIFRHPDVRTIQGSEQPSTDELMRVIDASERVQKEQGSEQFDLVVKGEIKL